MFGAVLKIPEGNVWVWVLDLLQPWEITGDGSDSQVSTGHCKWPGWWSGPIPALVDIWRVNQAMRDIAYLSPPNLSSSKKLKQNKQKNIHLAALRCMVWANDFPWLLEGRSHSCYLVNFIIWLIWVVLDSRTLSISGWFQPLRIWKDATYWNTRFAFADTPAPSLTSLPYSPKGQREYRKWVRWPLLLWKNGGASAVV